MSFCSRFSHIYILYGKGRKIEDILERTFLLAFLVGYIDSAQEAQDNDEGWNDSSLGNIQIKVSKNFYVTVKLHVSGPLRQTKEIIYNRHTTE